MQLKKKKKASSLWLISISEANLVVWFSEPEKAADRAILEETDKVSPLIQALICLDDLSWAKEQNADS